MVNRRSLLLSLLAAPLPLSAALAQPWWNEREENKRWHRYEEEERRRREARHERWDEHREHEAWERHQRELAQREWEHEHGPYRP
ncbi:MAG TPA: hypothetical protein VJ779_10855 [Acetobacteraceae bacterium]|jgi:hypothetical protein|nr:hypothetical protein [Acetobacteraceae bacterium]